MLKNQILKILKSSSVITKNEWKNDKKKQLYMKRYNFKTNEDFQLKAWYDKFKTGGHIVL